MQIYQQSTNNSESRKKKKKAKTAILLRIEGQFKGVELTQDPVGIPPGICSSDVPPGRHAVWGSSREGLESREPLDILTDTWWGAAKNFGYGKEKELTLSKNTKLYNCSHS